MLWNEKARAAAVSDLISQGGVGFLVLALAGVIELQSAALLQPHCSALLAAAFLMVAITVAIHRFGAGLKLFPRRLRLRIELEDLLFELRETIGHHVDPAVVMQSLKRIRRLVWTRPWRDRISAWQGRLQSNDLKDYRHVSVELRASLGEFATRSGSRMPLGNPVMLSGDSILRASGETAIYGALLGIASPGAPLFGTATLLGGLTIFLTVFASLRLLQILSCKVHDIRSKGAFRTIVVTHKQALSRIGAIAVNHLYSQIGHVVVICGEGELEDGYLPDAPGLYLVKGDKSSLGAALATFAPHADLIVLDTLDELTAREVRACTALSSSRYLALSDDGSAPPSYRWIDLRTLMILPSDPRARVAGGESYMWGVRRSRVRFSDFHFFICMASAMLFLRLDNGGPLAIFFLVAALGRVLPEFLGSRRLSAISRVAFRAPKAPETSRALDPRRLELRVWIATGLWWAASAAYLALSTGFHPEMRMDPTVLTMFGAFYLLLFGGPSIVSSLLILRKWSLDWNFRIIVLRRNARTFGYGHKASVLAVCGRYGQVFALYDYELDRTDDDTGEWRESHMGYWFRIFSQIEHTLKPDRFLYVWQRQVLIEMEVADFVVFDWVEEVTDNMYWELEQALRLLPANRVLIVCRPENDADVAQFLDSRLPAAAERPRMLIASRGRDDQYIWADHRAFETAFKAALHAAMTALTAEPRPPHERLQAGAWAFPCPADEAARTPPTQSASG